MVAAVFIRNCVCPVLKHDAHACDTRSQTRVSRTTTIGNAPDQAKALGDAIFDDTYRSINGAALCAATVDGRCEIDRIARPRVLLDFCEISK
ncbi:MAG: hypothetical protein B7Y00_01890 [Sphingomonadales bacterium 17-56-6]|nr:MAG: hypothetical protein B7Y00_01890 [Sphingomonadales bacterium 17-56-6]